jgi:hypothetical protein
MERPISPTSQSTHLVIHAQLAMMANAVIDNLK